MKQHFSCSLILSLFAVAAEADTGPDALEDGNPGWIIGFGYAAAPEPFVGDPDDASQFFPLVGYIGEKLTWLGPSISYEAWQDKDWSVSLAAEVDFDGFDADNPNSALASLTKRDSALEVGFDVDYGPLSMAIRHDISDTHNGLSADLSLATGWEFKDRFSIEAGIGAEWQSDSKTRYYYGVTSPEATATLPAYSPDAAINLQVGLSATYELNDRAFLILGADHTWLDSEITNSPIVADKRETSVFAGFIFDLFR